MPDRSLRLLTFPQLLPQGGERGAVLLRERPSSPPDAPSGDGGQERERGSQEDNPFAPPPEGTPDRPWQPRRPSGDDSQDSGGGNGGGSSPWGNQWSDQQPGRSPGGFGERPRGGPEGQGGGPQGGGSNARWDPTDPAQRRARYALLSGMWAFFFALFSWPYVALLLGALALYWAISSLRAKPRNPDPDSPAPEQQGGGRPQTTAAVSGLVAASVTAQLVYRDYYTCTNDALTNEAKQSCSQLLPEELRGFLETDD